MMSNFCQRETKVNISRFIDLLLISVDIFQFDAVVYIISPNCTSHNSYVLWWCEVEKYHSHDHFKQNNLLILKSV